MIGLAFAAAAAASAPTVIAQPALIPWQDFVGHCWSGPAPGGKAIDTHCFEAVYGGQHIRDRHEVKIDGRTVYAGETLYSVEGQDVTFTYWNSIGGVGRGKAVANGVDMSFAGEGRARPGSASESFTAQWRMGDGAYEVTDAGRTKARFQRVK